MVNSRRNWWALRKGGDQAETLGIFGFNQNCCEQLWWCIDMQGLCPFRHKKFHMIHVICIILLTGRANLRLSRLQSKCGSEGEKILSDRTGQSLQKGSLLHCKTVVNKNLLLYFLTHGLKIFLINIFFQISKRGSNASANKVDKLIDLLKDLQSEKY